MLAVLKCITAFPRYLIIRAICGQRGHFRSNTQDVDSAVGTADNLDATKN
jgi:hypothetical protein